MGQPAPAPEAPQTNEDPPPVSPPESGRQWSPSRRTWLAVAAVLALIATVVAAILVVADARDDERGERGEVAAADRVVTGPLGDTRDATLEVLDGATSITVRFADLGDRLYRAATPDGSHLVPRAVRTGERVQVYLPRRGPEGPSAVDVQLSTQVRWAVRVVGGAAEEVVDATGGRLAGVEVVGGVTRVEVRLPKPEGSVAVRMSGGANQFVVRAPTGVPVRVQVGGGAANVTIDGTARNGVSAGAVFSPPEWADAADRYQVDATGGVSVLTVERN